VTLSLNRQARTLKRRNMKRHQGCSGSHGIDNRTSVTAFDYMAIYLEPWLVRQRTKSIEGPTIIVGPFLCV